MLHSLYQVYTRLQCLNVSMSHSSTIRVIDKIGQTFDNKALTWKEKLLNMLIAELEVWIIIIHNHTIQYTSSMLCQPTSDVHLCTLPGMSNSDDQESDSDSDSDEFQSYSPISSDDEPSGDEVSNFSSESDDDCFATPETENNFTSAANKPRSKDLLETMTVNSFKIVGDNIDKTVKHHYI